MIKGPVGAQRRKGVRAFGVRSHRTPRQGAHAQAHEKIQKHAGALYTLENSSVYIDQVAIVDEWGSERHAFRTGEKVTFRIWWRGHTDEEKISIGLRLDGPRLLGVTGFASWEKKFYLNGGKPLNGRGCVELSIPRGLNLAPENILSASDCTVCADTAIRRRLFITSIVSQLSIHRRELHPFTFVYEPEFTIAEVEPVRTEKMTLLKSTLCEAIYSPDVVILGRTGRSRLYATSNALTAVCAPVDF